MKLDVCSDMTPFESSKSTTPSHHAALAKTVSVAERGYDINPLALVVNVTAPFINRVPPGFHTYHKPVANVTVFDRSFAVPELSATVSCTVARLPTFTLNSIARPSMSILPAIILHSLCYYISYIILCTPYGFTFVCSSYSMCLITCTNSSTLSHKTLH